MKKIAFEHGGPEYDRRYPDGIKPHVRQALDHFRPQRVAMNII